MCFNQAKNAVKHKCSSMIILIITAFKLQTPRTETVALYCKNLGFNESDILEDREVS